MVIYQIFTRIFGNLNTTRKPGGTLAENGSGKFADFDDDTLRRIREMGVTHLWYTGVIRHATQTDYSAYGIPTQHAEVVKGCAGSPYAIADYYDVDPDLATDVTRRMQEWEALIARTHRAGMGVVMDFVPNHVAREYRSVCRPEGVRDLGEDDDVRTAFSRHNDFYYCWGNSLDLSRVTDRQTYSEFPARATGNDHFDNCPGRCDWYETVKLNYGVNYCSAGGRSEHFSPMPDVWQKMTDILLFWAAKGVDAFRCDMAEMVPSAFWVYATAAVRRAYPQIQFIGEVYNPRLYHAYVTSGFDYLYDKVGMYDSLIDIIRHRRPATNITEQWQRANDILDHMLYFLENHDEPRLGSRDITDGHPEWALPAHIVCSLLNTSPYMLYAGQEFGEAGMDIEGFSGQDGRTTIFDYWSLDSLRHGYFAPQDQPESERALADMYRRVLRIRAQEPAAREGKTFDLMYVNRAMTERQYAFLRKAGSEMLLVVVNFDDRPARCSVCIPAHAFDFLEIAERTAVATDLLTGARKRVQLARDQAVEVEVAAHGGVIYKMKTAKVMDEYILNDHNKDEFAPAHTAEHLLNQLMVRMFGCGRSTNAHIERKKSKISYTLPRKPDRKEEKAIADEMNRLIEADMPVTFEYVERSEITDEALLARLPESAGDTLRLVRIGDYDVCPCIGKHVRSTAQIGRFEILGTNWDEREHSFRIRYKIVQ